MTQATIRCPECGEAAVEAMPTDACVYFWECPACHVLVKPNPGDCCVFCSYGAAPCPPMQQPSLMAPPSNRGSR